MKLGIAQSRLGDVLQRGRRNHTSEGARNAVALIVSHDEENVRRALGRHNPGRPPRLGISRLFSDHTPERHQRRRELVPFESYGGVGEPEIPLICWACTALTINIQITASTPVANASRPIRSFVLIFLSPQFASVVVGTSNPAIRKLPCPGPLLAYVSRSSRRRSSKKIAMFATLAGPHSFERGSLKIDHHRSHVRGGIAPRARSRQHRANRSCRALRPI